MDREQKNLIKLIIYEHRREMKGIEHLIGSGAYRAASSRAHGRLEQLYLRMAQRGSSPVHGLANALACMANDESHGSLFAIIVFLDDVIVEEGAQQCCNA